MILYHLFSIFKNNFLNNLIIFCNELINKSFVLAFILMQLFIILSKKDEFILFVLLLFKIQLLILILSFEILL